MDPARQEVDAQSLRDYGLQIRFIEDFANAPAHRGGGNPLSEMNSSSYGVQISIQGIKGQPFVVLNSSEQPEGGLPDPPKLTLPEPKTKTAQSLLAVNSNGSSVTTVDGLFQDAAGPKGNLYSLPRNATSDPSHKKTEYTRPDFMRAREQARSTALKGQSSSQKLNFQKKPWILQPYRPADKAQSCVDGQEREKSPKVGAMQPAVKGEPNGVGSALAGQATRVTDSASVRGPPLPAAGKTQELWGKRSGEKPPVTRSVSSMSEESGRAGSDVDSLGRSNASSASSRSRASPERPPIRSPSEDGPDELRGESANRHENRRYIPFRAGTGRDIDSGHILSIEELIGQFDEASATRGRPRRRAKISAGDRVRSRSLENFSSTRSGERENRAERSRVELDGPRSGTLWGQASAGGHDAPLEPRAKVATGAVTSSMRLTLASRVEATSGGGSVGAKQLVTTPDLLRDQTDVSQEASAKQFLYSVLREGNSESAESTHRKVNLVFEKIQTLGSKRSQSVSVQTEQAYVAVAELHGVQAERAQLQQQLREVGSRASHEEKSRAAAQAELAKLKESLAAARRDADDKAQEVQRWREQLEQADARLATTQHSLEEVEGERSALQREMRDLKSQLSEMHDELDQAKHSAAEQEERKTLLQELQRLGEVEESLRRRERELAALRGVLRQEVETREREMDEQRQRHADSTSKAQQKLETSAQRVLELEASAGEVGRALSVAAQQARRAEAELAGLREERETLQAELLQLRSALAAARSDEDTWKGRLGRLEAEQARKAEALEKADALEMEMEAAQRTLQTQLEELQRKCSRLQTEQQGLTARWQSSESQREELRQELEHEKERAQQQERTLERLRTELSESSETSARAVKLRAEFEELREKARRDSADLQRLLQEKAQALEVSIQHNTRFQQELKKVERDVERERGEREAAELENRRLDRSLQDMRLELSSAALRKDNPRQVKALEDRVSALQAELEEERENVELLTDKAEWARDQIEQLRGELMQEKAVRQDLECDKISLERQLKEMRGRVSDLEGSQRWGREGLASQMEARVRELEEALEREESERANAQANSRKLEKRLKELLMQVEEEHQQADNQKEEMSLRIKALKRQVNEAEEEIDRLDGQRRKVQRELEEQLELNEGTRAELNTLRKEMRQKRSLQPSLLMGNSDISSDEDDDDDAGGLDARGYDQSLRSKLIAEGELKLSSC
ncbi:cingulin-like protein 1 isoform X1 [Petromyzon marinus]|uniref:cingulin-like protein 1 isoform X1 n=1 Tax=Petromyzon marinus TaxID=7757 RepID=UPI003F7033C6